MKQPYRVPTMKEIATIQPNGFKVVSTFSGGGGSCTGYKMAGFNVVWANEFIPLAQSTYRANHPDTHLNTKDIRQVTGTELLRESGLSIGEIDLFDGSPPCASFSTAGSREKAWGKVKKYSDTVQRVDDLFYEYVRLIKETQPRTFVAENVSGLIKGKAKGYFKEIFNALKQAGYQVKAKLLNGQWLGVPQMRERLIFVGVRNDLGLEPTFPKPRKPVYTLYDAIGHMQLTHEEKAMMSIKRFQIGELYHELKPGTNHPKRFNLYRCAWNRPAPTILQASGALSTAGAVHPDEPRKFTIQELKAICGFPPDYQLTGEYPKQVERLGRAVPPLMMKAIAETIRDEILCKIP
jgi:DNA (cytosine-5)-methyltransferase 1